MTSTKPSPEAVFQQASVLSLAGNLREARATLDPIVQSPAAPPAILAAAGHLDLALGRLASARRVLERAVVMAPEAPAVLEDLGRVFWRTGKLDDAARLLGQVVRRWPRRASAWVAFGEVRLRQRRLPDVDAASAQLLMVAPESPDGHRLRTLVALERGRLEGARLAIDIWLNAFPRSTEAMSLLADLQSRGRHFDQAEATFQDALGRAPNDLALRTRYAHHRGRRGDFLYALQLFTDIARQSPEQAIHIANRGIAQMWAGQLDAAVQSLEAAAQMEPSNANHRWNLSHAILQSGDYRRGFEIHEQRVALFGPPSWWNTRWRGEALPKGTPLFLDAAQGLGDAIQFVRFAQDAADRGAAVTVRAHSRILPLFASADGVSAGSPKSDAVGPGVKRARLLSLPHAIGVEASSDLGHRVPYLYAEPERVARWTERIRGPDFKVGIVWQGNPAYDLDHLRSPPLRHYLPLTALDGIQAFSLQKFHGVDQLASVDPSTHPIVDLGPELDLDVAFLDTAATMKALDLVITSDTSIAHLAGALGVPTWVVLPFAPDWRWPRTGSQTPWYPTMRLFRQTQSGDWAGVLKRVATALSERAASEPSR